MASPLSFCWLSTTMLFVPVHRVRIPVVPFHFFRNLSGFRFPLQPLFKRHPFNFDVLDSRIFGFFEKFFVPPPIPCRTIFQRALSGRNMTPPICHPPRLGFLPPHLTV